MVKSSGLSRTGKGGLCPVSKHWPLSVGITNHDVTTQEGDLLTGSHSFLTFQLYCLMFNRSGVQIPGCRPDIMTGASCMYSVPTSKRHVGSQLLPSIICSSQFTCHRSHRPATHSVIDRTTNKPR